MYRVLGCIRVYFGLIIFCSNIELVTATDNNQPYFHKKKRGFYLKSSEKSKLLDQVPAVLAPNIAPIALKMAVYFIVSYDIEDPQAYEAYVPGVLPLLKKQKAEVLGADNQAKPLEGQGRGLMWS